MKKLWIIGLFLLIVLATSVSALNVTLTSPSDTERFYSPVNITFVGNASESATADSRVANISLFLSDRTNASATLVAVNWTAVLNTTTNKTSFTILSTNLSAGNYTWKFVAVNNETTPVTNSSSNRTFEVFNDVAIPGINASTNINKTNLTLGSYNYLFNVSIADNTAFANVTLMINGSRNATNTTSLINGTQGFNFTFAQPTTNLTFYWAVEACDRSGNCNQSQNITLYLDFNNDYYPQVNLSTPVDTYNLTNGFSTIFNATISEDTAFANVSLMINGSINSTNTSGMVSGANFPFPFTFGSANLTYNWAVRVCDAGGLCNITANRTFSTYTDVSFPAINITSFINGTNYTSAFKPNFENLIFTAIIAEGTQLGNMSLLINSTRNATLTNTTTLANGTYTLNFSLGLSNRTYTWAIEACDRSGNCNQSANMTMHTFFDDVTGPLVAANYTNSSVTLGEPLSLFLLFSEGSLNASNTTCRITLNGVKSNATINATVANSTHAWCNYSYNITSDYYPNITALVNVSDAYNNSIEHRFVTDFNLRCADSITGNFTLYENMNCGSSTALNISASSIKVDLGDFHINGTAGYNGISFQKNASNVLLTGGTIRLFSRGIFINGSATANNITVGLLTNNSVGIFATTTDNKIMNINASYSTEKALNLSNATTGIWNITARNRFINSNISFNGTIAFATGGVLELIGSYLTLNGTFINTTGNITSLRIYNPVITVNVSNSTAFEDADANVTLYLRNTVTSTLTVTQDLPSSTPSGYRALKGVDIVADAQTRDNLTWAYVVVFYNSSELESAGIVESSLKMYFYNTTSSAWEIEKTQFVSATEDYVLANVTHFSLFGVFGTAATPADTGGSSSGGGGGGSDTCSEDWVCTSWSACSGGAQTRSCADAAGCGTSSSKPATSKTCTVTAPATTPPAQAPKAVEQKPAAKPQPAPIAGKAVSPGGAGTTAVLYTGAAIVAVIVIALIIYFVRKR